MSILFYWKRADPDHVEQFYGPNANSLNLMNLLGTNYHEFVFTKFRMVPEADAEKIREDIPAIPLLCAPAPLRPQPMDVDKPQRENPALPPWPYEPPPPPRTSKRPLPAIEDGPAPERQRQDGSRIPVSPSSSSGSSGGRPD